MALSGQAPLGELGGRKSEGADGCQAAQPNGSWRRRSTPPLLPSPSSAVGKSQHPSESRR
jgi:hypothetical protein